MVLPTGRAGNLAVMRARRFALLVLGFAGSVLAVAMLYISVEGALPDLAPAMTEPVTSITLPYAVPDTDLIVQQISYYEGPFLEDGTDREVVDIPALHLYNAGACEILRTCITVHTSDTAYVFYGEHLPPDATTVLLEKDAKPYRRGDISACTGWQERGTDTPLQGVQITEVDMGTISVTNLTDNTLRNVRIYYKSWLSPPGVYMGGNTYQVVIPVFLPGQTDYLHPDHYAAGYTKVVLVVSTS